MVNRALPVAPSQLATQRLMIERRGLGDAASDLVASLLPRHLPVRSTGTFEPLGNEPFEILGRCLLNLPDDLFPANTPQRIAPCNLPQHPAQARTAYLPR